MQLNEPLIRMGHPPHFINNKRTGSLLPGLLIKITLFIVILILSIHLPNFNPRNNNRQETIRQIFEILEKHQTGLDNVTKGGLAEAIYEESLYYDHDPKFILALIAIESSFQNWSVSKQGAKGLMQLMPYVAESIALDLGIEWKGDHTLFDPYINIKIGIHYLSQLILDFNDVGIALTAYNYGPTYVKGLIERKQQIPIHYYRRVLTTYQNL